MSVSILFPPPPGSNISQIVAVDKRGSKTELCESVISKGTCEAEHKCQFAHHPNEMAVQVIHKLFKKNMCANGANCKYTYKCRFAHYGDEFEYFFHEKYKTRCWGIKFQGIVCRIFLDNASFNHFTKKLPPNTRLPITIKILSPEQLQLALLVPVHPQAAAIIKKAANEGNEGNRKQNSAKIL